MDNHPSENLIRDVTSHIATQRQPIEQMVSRCASERPLNPIAPALHLDRPLMMQWQHVSTQRRQPSDTEGVQLAPDSGPSAKFVASAALHLVGKTDYGTRTSANDERNLAAYA